MKLRLTIFLFLCLALSAGFLSVLQAQNFANPLPIPYLLPGPEFDIEITSAQHNFDPNGTLTDINLNVMLSTYCYNEVGNTGMTYNGPTLAFEKGEEMNFDITNSIDEDMGTTVHWHGLNIPAKEDGGPHQVIEHNTTWSPNLPIVDPVQTIWYHSHLMDFTTDQVIRGMAGLIVVEDPENDPLYSELPHDYGVNDIPLNIQEKGFVLDSSTTPPTATAIKAGEKPGNGPWTLVNGVVNAVARVPRQVVRLRILNGSPRKMFHIGLSTELENPTTFADMVMIATGGGYLPESIPVSSSLMAVGDRIEFLVDFSAYEDGATLYMSNLAVPSDADYGKTLGSALMAFVVDASITPDNPVTTIPEDLDTEYALAPGEVARTRDKELLGKKGSGDLWTIDGTPMQLDVINDIVLVNTKEKWIIHNTTDVAHPFHIHKVQFQVTRYDGLLGTMDDPGQWEYPDLPPDLIGYKDVQLIRAGATLEFEARFDFFPSPLLASEGFMYHCHILTHEDNSMMHQFVVVDSADFPTSVKEPSTKNVLMVHPNPVSNSLSLEGSFNEPGTLRIYNLAGQVIKEEVINVPSNAVVDVRDLPRGAVVVEFSTATDRFIQKVLLE